MPKKITAKVSREPIDTERPNASVLSRSVSRLRSLSKRRSLTISPRYRR